MPKRSSKKEDANEAAFRIVQESTRERDLDVEPTPYAQPTPPLPRKKNAAAVELGRKGGLKGGKARAAKLSPEQRRDIAKRAAAKRWSKPVE